jgi:hypothetical protein
MSGKRKSKNLDYKIMTRITSEDLWLLETLALYDHKVPTKGGKPNKSELNRQLIEKDIERRLILHIDELSDAVIARIPQKYIDKLPDNLKPVNPSQNGEAA